MQSCAATAGTKDTFYWDTDLRGFGLRVTAAGTKTFLVQYRIGGRGTPTHRHTIGKLGLWSAASARVEAERLLHLVASGTDLRMEVKERVRLRQQRECEEVLKEQERQRTEQELAFTPYAERFLALYGKQEWRSRTYKSAESNMRRWVFPVIDCKPLPSITHRDLTGIFDGLPPSSPPCRGTSSP